MNKQLAVHTSYPDNPCKSFNEWHQWLHRQRQAFREGESLKLNHIKSQTDEQETID